MAKSIVEVLDNELSQLLVDIPKQKKHHKGKPVEQYEISTPMQLSLFQETSQPFSNTIEIYDAIPKYVFGRPVRENGKYLSQQEREFVFRKQKFNLRISPARLSFTDPKTKKKTEMEYFPGRKEELVEDALRKLAIDASKLLDGEVGVMFTLYQLQVELKSHGHSYSINQIKQAIEILKKTTYEIWSEGDEDSPMMFNALPTAQTTTKTKWKKSGKDAKSYAIFSPFVTHSINNNTYRQINYETFMGYKHHLSRWLHKRISHNFTQATSDTPFTINLSTVQRDSCMPESRSTKLAKQDFEKAIAEMIEEGTLTRYGANPSYDPKRRNRIIDWKYSMYLSEALVSEIITANVEMKRRVGKLETASKYLEN